MSPREKNERRLQIMSILYDMGSGAARDLYIALWDEEPLRYQPLTAWTFPCHEAVA